jgi:hypothetical protein
MRVAAGGPEHPTLPSLLRAGGYATALIGKWHLGSLPKFGPLLSGYDEFFGPMGGGVDYFSHVNFSGMRDLWEGDEASQAHGYLTDLIAQRAADYVARPHEKPFFLSVHFTAPHWPWETRDDVAESQRIGSNIVHLDGGSVVTYLKMISHMDEGIGQIIGALPASQRDNTLVVFISDNGGERFSNNWPFVGGKMDLLEGGIRIPTDCLVARQHQGGIDLGRSNSCNGLDADNARPCQIASASGLSARRHQLATGIRGRPVVSSARAALADETSPTSSHGLGQLEVPSREWSRIFIRYRRRWPRTSEFGEAISGEAQRVARTLACVGEDNARHPRRCRS